MTKVTVHFKNQLADYAITMTHRTRASITSRRRLRTKVHRDVQTAVFIVKTTIALHFKKSLLISVTQTHV